MLKFSKTLDAIALEAKIVIENIPVAAESLALQWKRKLRGTRYRTLDEVIWYAKEKTGSKKVNLVGHSLGGLIALTYTIGHPEQVGQCITLSTPFQGTYAAYIGALFTFLCINPKPAFQMIPESNFLKSLQEQFQKHFLAFQKNKLTFKNIYSEHDELLSKRSASLKALAQCNPGFIQESKLSGYGHGAVMYSEEAYQTITETFRENPYPLIFIHGFALNRSFYNKKLERLRREYPEFTKGGEKRRIFHFTYDYTKALQLR
ncbi:alpha/beta fold hydrolase [Candidatus Woesearchaeota archaeon]|nr:alpha/beta fold hydrolase [Candidatus Woesearchaeota archaeon]